MDLKKFMDKKWISFNESLMLPHNPKSIIKKDKFENLGKDLL